MSLAARRLCRSLQRQRNRLLQRQHLAFSPSHIECPVVELCTGSGEGATEGVWLWRLQPDAHGLKQSVCRGLQARGALDVRLGERQRRNGRQIANQTSLKLERWFNR